MTDLQNIIFGTATNNQFAQMNGADNFANASGPGLLKRVFAPKKALEENAENMYADFLKNNPLSVYRTYDQAKAKFDEVQKTANQWMKKMQNPKDAAEKRVATKNYQIYGWYARDLADIMKKLQPSNSSNASASPKPTAPTSTNATPNPGALGGKGTDPKYTGGTDVQPNQNDADNAPVGSNMKKTLTTLGIVAGLGIVAVIVIKKMRKK